MKKWFLLAFVLIPALPFAAGLRIDFEILAEKLQKKPDHNAEALRKMGIDPGQVDFKGKPWWTFRPEDSLIKRISGWNPVKQMSDETWASSRKIKNELVKKQYGIDLEETLKEQARDAAAKAEFRKQLTEQRMEEAQ